jgi:hypothetical protein
MVIAVVVVVVVEDETLSGIETVAETELSRRTTMY